MSRFLILFAWAWLIIIGALMIYPGGVQCIACGVTLTRIIGVISVLVGVGGFVTGRSAATAG
jgi:hypothetical protein